MRSATGFDLAVGARDDERRDRDGGKHVAPVLLEIVAFQLRRGFRPGQKVKHPKYGEGTVYQREGEGEEAKITVQFPRCGLKKLVEKYAQLEKA